MNWKNTDEVLNFAIAFAGLLSFVTLVNKFLNTNGSNNNSPAII